MTASCFGDGCDKRVDHRHGSVLSTFRQGCLDLDCSMMIAVSCRRSLECVHPVHQGLVARHVLCGETEFENDRTAESDEPVSQQRPYRRSDERAI